MGRLSPTRVAVKVCIIRDDLFTRAIFLFSFVNCDRGCRSSGPGVNPRPLLMLIQTRYEALALNNSGYTDVFVHSSCKPYKKAFEHPNGDAVSKV